MIAFTVIGGLFRVWSIGRLGLVALRRRDLRSRLASGSSLATDYSAWIRR